MEVGLVLFETESPLDMLSRAACFVETDQKWTRDSYTQVNGDNSRDSLENRDSPSKDLPTKLQRQNRTKCRQDLTDQLNIDEEHRARINNTKCVCTQTPLSIFDQYSEVRKQLNQVTVGPNVSTPPPSVSDGYFSGQDMPLNLTVGPQSRPSVIIHTNVPSQSSSPSSSPVPLSPNTNGPNRRDVMAGMCDSVIDEHFRRSLGKKYPECFPESQKSKLETVPSVPESVDDHFAKSLGQTWQDIKAKNEILNLDLYTGTVDDHFAKALGDKWHQIKAKNDKNSPSPPVGTSNLQNTESQETW